MTVTRGPHWSPIDDDTHDLLSVVADPHPVVGAELVDLFLEQCRRDAATHGGFVSVNRVRARLADQDIPPRRYSALWGHFTGPGRPMVKAKDPATGEHLWEACRGSTSGNNGRPYPIRRWVA